LKFIWIFSGRNHLKNQYLPHFESKSYQINSIKILLIKIFPTTPKAHSNSSEIFSYSEEIIQYSRTFAPQVQMSWNQSPCTLPHLDLSKDTKNTIWIILVGWIS
jgi:hypothetical protein